MPPPPPPAAALAASFAAGDAAAVDLEACTPLRNAAAVAAAGVCVAVRGGCPFALKTLNCQAAGAKLVVLLNNNFAERGAPNSWGLGAGIAPAAIRIPTVALSARDGARMLTWLLDPAAADNAPLDAIYKKKDGTWATFKYVENADTRWVMGNILKSYGIETEDGA